MTASFCLAGPAKLIQDDLSIFIILKLRVVGLVPVDKELDGCVAHFVPELSLNVDVRSRPRIETRRGW
jgi:hypothetical protein